MHAVGATDHRHVDEFMGSANQHRHELAGGLDEQVRGLGQLPAQRGVDDVRGGEAVVDPGTLGRPDPILDDVHESGRVVVGDRLPLIDGGDEGGIDHGRPGPAGRSIGGRDGAELGQRLGGQELDLQHGAEAGLVAEQGRHIGGCVPRDHDPSFCAASAAMSRRRCAPSKLILSAPS